jgi:hypothetical protein
MILKGTLITPYFGRLCVASPGEELDENANSAFFGCMKDRAIRTIAQPFLKVEG